MNCTPDRKEIKVQECKKIMGMEMIKICCMHVICMYLLKYIFKNLFKQSGARDAFIVNYQRICQVSQINFCKLTVLTIHNHHRRLFIPSLLQMHRTQNITLTCFCKIFVFAKISYFKNNQNYKATVREKQDISVSSACPRWTFLTDPRKTLLKRGFDCTAGSCQRPALRV